MPWLWLSVTGEMTTSERSCVPSHTMRTPASPAGVSTGHVVCSRVGWGFGESSVSDPPAVHVPVRKAMEEMCPSPTALSERMKRTAPSSTPDWSG